VLLVLPWRDTVRRLPRVCGGLVLFGVGIAMMVAGDLGLGPWDVFHQGLADLSGIDIGLIIILVGVVVLAGFIPLREKVGLGTLLNAVLIGLTVNLVLRVLEEPDGLAPRFLLMAAGPVVIAIGSGLYIGGGLGPGPRDGIMTGLSRRGIAVWKARTGIEASVFVAGVLLGGAVGIGTIWFAVGIGPMVGFFLPRLTPTDPG
jgi:uncharacterized membrane protein YczE